MDSLWDFAAGVESLCDLLCDLALDLEEALLGTIKEVETIEGPVSLKVPPCTQPGAMLRLQGRGIGGGDHKVRIQVRLPERLSDRQQELVREIFSVGEGQGPGDRD